MKARFLTPAITAFKEDGQLDMKANQQVYDHLIRGGIDGIVILGSTGEFFNISKDQQKELMDMAISYINHRTKVYVGTSFLSVEETIEMTNYAHRAGADAVMIISPYYFSLTEESIEAYYNEVAAATKAQIYLYNYPARTGYDLSPELTLRLLKKNRNIIGYKDTVTEMAHTRELIGLLLTEFPKFDILSGFDENFIHNVLSGGGGCIGGLSNLVPEVFSNMVKAVNEKNYEKMAASQKKVDQLMQFYAIGTPFIPIIKKAMMLRGINMEDYCTKPFLRADEKQIVKIKALMNALNIEIVV